MAATAGWTVEQLRAIPDNGNRYEIIDGQLLVTPAPSLRHQDAADELCDACGLISASSP